MNSMNERERFIVSRWAYSMGESLIDDSEYNRLVTFMKSEYPDDPYTKRTWSDDPCPVELLRKIGREDLICNVTLTDATESIPSINTWVDLKNKLELWQGTATLSMKHDGWNTQFNYYNGELFNVHTRGRTGGKMNVNRLSALVPMTIPAKGRVKIVQELTCKMYLWPEIRQKYGNANPRNAVHTLLANPDTDQYLQLHAVDVHGAEITGKNKFEMLKEWGFDIPLYHTIHDYNDLLYAMREMSDNRVSYEAPTDGVVFCSDTTSAIRLMAWEEQVYESYVIGYNEKYSMHRINPSVRIYPVLCAGRKQRQVNITNWKRIISNNLQVGLPIAFRNASEAIADVDEEVTRMLQKQWKGKEAEWQQHIKDAEDVKRHQLDTLGVIHD